MTPPLQRALAGLNPQQREAVLHFDSPLLILAGAGSGKTRVITVKIAYLIDQMEVNPRSILAVTFTNKAAGEMRERATGLSEPAKDATIRTFHSFGSWLLRRNADVLGLSRSFTIYDDDDAVTLLRSLYPQFNRNTCTLLSRQISRAKDFCLTWEDDLTEVSDDPEFSRIYQSYQRRLEEIGNVDFGDLIMRTVQMLERNPSLASRIRSRFRYILVDEYQDSNVAQYRLLRALADETTFVSVVGDDDQSIYRFRGAEVQNILSFPSTFNGTRVVKLEENYRSTRPILDIAGAVVSRNEGRLGKTLFTQRKGGTQPELALMDDQEQEIDYVVDLVNDGIRRGQETAILYRTNAQSRSFETAFLRLGIAYRIIGSLRFYDREEVKDAVAFLKFFVNPKDEVSFRRIINKPARSIGAKSIEKVLSCAYQAGGNLLSAAAAVPDLSRKARESIGAFLEMVAGLGSYLAPEVPPEEETRDSAAAGGISPDFTGILSFDDEPVVRPGEPDANLGLFVEHTLKNSGLWRFHQDQDKVTGTQKVQNMEELINAASLYAPTRAGLIDFLEAVELDSAREREDDDDAKVVLITMHNTKGLEFDRVIVSGLEEGLFPRNTDPDEMEEERRLFYVAITRAKNELFLTSCTFRRIHGRLMQMLPSPFLAEIPEDLYRVRGGSGGRGGRVTGRAGFSRDPSAAGEVHDWPRGSTVYHDEYGSGVVIKSWFSGSEPCVMVRFETGRTAQFLPKYATLERVAGGFA